METIKKLVELAHSNAIEKGFYDFPIEILDKMKNSFYVDSVHTRIFSDNKIKAVKDAFISQRLMLIASELGEALEANRNNREANLQGFDNDSSSSNFQENFERNIKDSFSDELADVAIRLFDLAGWLNIDLQKHIELKHKYNSTRQKMHGGKKY
jgi:NTP pyrophosphatase (non-canonical NTP hydrolase)